MTAAENIAFGLEMRGVPRAEREVRVRDALAMVGLDGFADRYPRRMSGGQQQRVALARALVIKPDVLLLDEPLSNLDAKLREDMQIELRQIQRSIGTTTVLVTHDQTEAMALSDRIVVMSKGRIEQIGTPHEAYERPASAFVSQFLGKTNEFPGEIDRHAASPRLVAGSCQWPAPAGASGPVTVTVRPEKVGFGSESDSGLEARITNRIFQGNHWLFQCETECGPAIVVRQNTGKAQPAEGENVRLVWRPEDMVIRPGGGGR
jgi:putative spermidine/putrescine transport system ATP-binding protein